MTTSPSKFTYIWQLAAGALFLLWAYAGAVRFWQSGFWWLRVKGTVYTGAVAEVLYLTFAVLGLYLIQYSVRRLLELSRGT